MTIRIPLLAFCRALLLSGLCLFLISPAAQAVDLSLKSMRVGNLARAYFSERGGRGMPQPLIIALHGSGSSGSLLARNTGLTEIAEAAGYMVAYPNGTGLTIDARTWNSGGCCGYAQMHKVDDVAFIRALIDKLVSEGLADRSRVYVAGLSNGGMLAYRLAAEAPELFKGVAVVSAVLDVPPETVKAGVPVLHIHGSDDPFIPFLGGVGPKEATQVPRLSVAKTIDAWVKANGADPRPDINDIPDTAGDGTSVRQYTYHSKSDPQAVVLYEIKGGGHNWPGGTAPMSNGGKASQNLDASRVIVEFFNRHGGQRPADDAADRNLPPGTATPMAPAAPTQPTR
ncbi:MULTISPECIES: PHB depolymerase family esterase [unclassified Herbaspirillum]|uniref:extracellular catalytic domain type 1 short-chain-length polyhydroxyalkanoate depolymerase n=1 Tax=unclassified Herbaspirillum TaxID=2624150 RepID=UPI00114FA701|nr:MULTISPECIES: PHB depolymerase family esterase [unclassified Herbaspirillum]MBB5393362.1 polyhydroxybutyrate depolymerase [Herbaspirillum sp. SJZ102]TQK03890.1 polyhydroxybutyrate depolymerase [Herbaspirillum sp. SJZ130]TQK08622.1 polyhydroxybutyrate depolymerase [Herbaspirillum sp. SJZ106]TWC71892.1 polyhydroxybutyrate depolymerase [Herbaspirillum sp. SJZ099]